MKEDQIVPKIVEARNVTVTNYCPVLDRFLEKNPEYLRLIDADNPGRWPKQQQEADQQQDAGQAQDADQEGDPR